MKKSLLILFLLLNFTQIFAQKRISNFVDSLNSNTNPRKFVKFGGHVLFLSVDTTNTENIWIIENATANPRVFKQATKTKNLNNTFQNVVLNDTLYYIFDQAFWKMASDLKPILVYENDKPGFFEDINLAGNRIFFNKGSFYNSKTGEIRFIKKHKLFYPVMYSPDYPVVKYSTEYALYINRIDNFEIFDFKTNKFEQVNLFKPINNSFQNIKELYQIEGQRYISNKDYGNKNSLQIYQQKGMDFVLITEFNADKILAEFKVGNTIVFYTNADDGVKKIVFENNQLKEDTNFKIKTENKLKQVDVLYENEIDIFCLSKNFGNLDLIKINKKTDSVTDLKRSIKGNFLSTLSKNQSNTIFRIYPTTESSENYCFDFESKNIFKVNPYWQFSEVASTSNQLIGACNISEKYEPYKFSLASGTMKFQILKGPINYSTSILNYRLFKNNNQNYIFRDYNENQTQLFQINGTQLDSIANIPILLSNIQVINFQKDSINLTGEYYENSNKGIFNFGLNFRKKTQVFNKVLINNGVYYFLKDTAVLHIANSRAFYQSFINPSYKYTKLLDSTYFNLDYTNYKKIQNLIYFFKSERASIDKELRVLNVFDFKNKVVLRPEKLPVRYFFIWQNRAFVVIGKDVFIYDSINPLKKKFLFSFQYDSQKPFLVTPFETYFMISNGNEVWINDGSCSFSSQVFINYDLGNDNPVVFSPYFKNAGVEGMINGGQTINYYKGNQTKKFRLSQTELSFNYTSISTHSFIFTTSTNGLNRLWYYDFNTEKETLLLTYNGPTDDVIKNFFLNNYDQEKETFLSKFGLSNYIFKKKSSKEFNIQEINIPDDIKSDWSLQKINDNYYLANRDNLLIYDNFKPIKIDSGTYYISRYESKSYIYFLKPNKEILKLNKQNLEYKIIKPNITWESIWELFIVDSKLYAIIKEYSRGIQIWQIDDEMQEPMPVAEPINFVIAESECNPKQDEIATKKFTVFPNPASEKINILMIENTDVSSMTLLDIKGQTVKNINQVNSDNPFQELNIAYLPSGLYFLVIKGINFQETHRIFKN